MGICLSAEEKAEKQKNAAIDSQLKRDAEISQNEVKMLLLGAGESGKSTILKQMQLIHGSGYTDAEKIAFKEVIFSNIIQTIKVICEAMVKLGIPLGDPGNEGGLKIVNELPFQIEGEVFPPDAYEAIKALWKDAGVQNCYKRASEYQLNDSAKYYLDDLDRICGPGFSPSDQDVLRSRVKSTGITETTFHIGDSIYRMFDVGGQRSERKKWIHCFENVTAIVFLVAISEYDQVLREDESVNRMQEALTLFDSICNSRWFVKTSIILFLNKIDIFKDKLVRIPIETSFPDYDGGLDFDIGTDYFRQKFISLNQSTSKQVYSHLTCGTDTGQIKFVMAAVNDIIIQNNLRDAGLV